MSHGWLSKGGGLHMSHGWLSKGGLHVSHD